MKLISYFDCSFLSKYPSENEWLFCGGRYGIKVETVRIQETSQNCNG